ncbi:putative bifunctional diguanylate cyclase/phosphodiesterase [Blastococcus sp. SYSU D00820]
MATTPRSRLLPGTPRWVLAAVLGLAAFQVAAVVLPAGALPAPDSPVGLLLRAPMHVGICALLLWRARTVATERTVFWRLALGAVVLGTLVLTCAVLVQVPAAAAAGAALLAWTPVVAFPFFYSGLIRWNRYSTSLADPNDVLNGVSAVLAVVAVLNVAAPYLPGDLAARPFGELQPLFAYAATGAVLAGTALSVVFLGAMRRDPRIWLVAGLFSTSLVGNAATLLTGGAFQPWTAAVEPLGIAALAVTACLRPSRTAPQPTDPTASTIGAFVVIMASTAVLLAQSLSAQVSAATWCAALAAFGAGLRMLVNVRELAQLAVSRREALTDELTGLANRRAVLRRVEELGRGGLPQAFALLDLDKFKEVNDGLGHGAGDELLRLVAARLEPALRAGDLLGRLGGDEFAVVAALEPDAVPEAAATALCRRLHERLAEPFLVEGMSVHVTASIGSTTAAGGVPGGSCTPTTLLRQADAAMYDAKRSGTGSAVYDVARHSVSSGHLALVEELRAGLGRGELVLHHQPQVDVGTGRVVGVEALVRWAHPVRGLLPPGEFLPLAEVHGLMGTLTDTVVAGAVAQLAQWQRAGLDLRMSVNLSASNLLDTRLPERVAGLLRLHGVRPQSLTLEVTESVLLSDPERSLQVIQALADLGTTVSIDDFGTGYSSLAYLRALPVGELKLDRSFTAELLTDARTEAIVASTVELAHRLGLRVVAEGVEDEATLARLAALGCDESQGYLHSRGLPADELVSWLCAGELLPVG